MLFRIFKVGQKFKMRCGLRFVHVNNRSTYKTLFIIFQVLYKEGSAVREAYTDILYNSRQRRGNFTVKKAYQSLLVSKAYYCVIIDKTTTSYLRLFNGINPQP